MKRNNIYFLATLVLMTGAIVWLLFAKTERQPFSAHDIALPPSENDIRIGSNDAAYKVVIYTDYECPYCRTVDEAIPYWIEKYGKEKIAFYLRHLPLTNIHPRALEFAKIVECVKRQYGDEHAFAMGKHLYDRMPLGAVETLQQYADGNEGFSDGAVLECAGGSEVIETIKKHAHEALAQSLARTPSFMLYDTERGQYIYKRAGGGVKPYEAYFDSFFAGQ